MNEHYKKTEFKGYIRRRKKIFLISFLIISLSAVAVAFILPDVYSSQATILIEEQKNIIAVQKRTEKELKKHREHLEELVKERTAELMASNEQLREEITERKRVEQALKASEENLQDLIYIASHDLQTPIVSLAGYANNLLKKLSAKKWPKAGLQMKWPMFSSCSSAWPINVGSILRKRLKKV